MFGSKKEKATKPKFETDLNINPKEIQRPISGGDPWKIIIISSKIYTSGSRKIPINFIIIHPNGRNESNMVPAVAEEGHNTANVSLSYPIEHASEVGDYEVIAEIRNCESTNEKDCKRNGLFTVK